MKALIRILFMPISRWFVGLFIWCHSSKFTRREIELMSLEEFAKNEKQIDTDVQNDRIFLQ